MQSRIEVIINKIQNCRNPTLNLENLGISDTEIKTIIDKVNEQQHIVILCLRYNFLTDLAANQLAQHLINLCAVILDNNGITQKGTIALVQSEKFALIDLEENPISYDEALHTDIMQNQNLSKMLLGNPLLDYSYTSDLATHFALRREELKRTPRPVSEDNALHMIKMINSLLINIVIAGNDYLTNTPNPTQNDHRIALALTALGSHFKNINEQDYNYNNVLIAKWIPMPIILTGMKERSLAGELAAIITNDNWLNAPRSSFKDDIDPVLCQSVRSTLIRYQPFKSFLVEETPSSENTAIALKHDLRRLQARLLSVSMDPTPPGMHYVLSAYSSSLRNPKVSIGGDIGEQKSIQTAIRETAPTERRNADGGKLNWFYRNIKPIFIKETVSNEEKPSNNNASR
jgi:hypothetical protein